MTRRRASVTTPKPGLGSRIETAGRLRHLLRPVVTAGWRLTRRILNAVPGGRRVVDQVVTRRILALEAAEKAKLAQGRERQFFPGRDLTGVTPQDIAALVPDVVDPAEADARTLAAVIAEIAHAGGQDVKALYRRYRQDALDAFLQVGGVIRAPSSDAPKVSVILVLYNNAELTLPCLQALQSEHGAPVEVVIVDNASSDRTPALLDAVKGARIIRNTENVGFLLAVNQAAEMARGDHLLLLNNDATLRAGALDAALRRLESDASIGAVGGRIVLLDGTLQEAGSIVWNDATCIGYARGDAEDAPHAMFVRDVDYCSGAFLLTPKRVWDALGGFDPAFAPAYYEEADYCMRLRANGYRVVYEPRAVIDHFEFGSATKSAWAIAQQRKNRAVFAARHGDALADQFTPATANIPRARSRLHPEALRVLVIDDRVPHRQLGSGYPRAADMIESLVSAGHEVSVYPLQVPFEPWDSVYDALPDTVEAVMGSGVAGLEDYLAANIARFDVVIVSRPLNMAFVKAICDRRPELFSGVRIAYDAEAVFARREIARSAAAGRPLPEDRANAMINDEVALTEPAHVIAAVSEAEAALFRSTARVPVVVLGHKIEPQPGATPFELRSGLVFVGALVGEDGPNVDSMTWFADAILPRVNERLDRPVTLNIVGTVESEAIKALASPHVVLHGPVPDLAAVYDRSRLLVAPTRYAAGVPRKVHDAAAHGLPCVVTELIASLLGWTHEEAVLVGRDADAFADQVVRLYTDEAVWRRIRAGALQKLETDCAPAAFDTAVGRLLRS